jgi:Leucine-rich repeat (LRR) protein
VKIELIYNFIYQIGNISCLLCLDTLDLSHNNIKYLGNGTCDGLTNLRVLRLTHNDITTLEPSTLVGSSLQIHHADLSHNSMAMVEISNLVSENKFCEFDFSSNKITEMINTNNFKIDPTKTYKGGFLELTDSTVFWRIPAF